LTFARLERPPPHKESWNHLLDPLSLLKQHQPHHRVIMEESREEKLQRKLAAEAGGADATAPKKKKVKKKKRKSNDGDLATAEKAPPPPPPAMATAAVPSSPAATIRSSSNTTTSSLIDEKAAYRNSHNSNANVTRVEPPSMMKGPPERTKSSESSGSGKKLKKQTSKKKLKKGKTNKNTGAGSLADEKAAARAQKEARLLNEAPLPPASRQALGTSRQQAAASAAPTALNREVSQPGAYRHDEPSHQPAQGVTPPAPQQYMANRRGSNETDPERGEVFEDEVTPGNTADDGSFLVTATLVEEPSERGGASPRRQQQQQYQSNVPPGTTKLVTVDAKLISEDDDSAGRRTCIIASVVCCCLLVLVGGLVGVLVAVGVFGGGGDDSTPIPTPAPSTAPTTAPSLSPAVPSANPTVLTPTTPTSPTFFNAGPPWWENIGSHPVYFAASSPSAPTVTNAIADVFTGADYAAVYYVQWGYHVEPCGGMFVPPRLELTCGGAPGAALAILEEDRPRDSFCQYRDDDQSFGLKHLICHALSFSFDPLVSYLPDPPADDAFIPFVYTGLFKVICTYRSPQPSEAGIALTARSLPFQGQSCGEEEGPNDFVAKISTGMTMASFCYGGAAPLEENLLYQKFERGDGELTKGTCNAEDGTLPLSGGNLGQRTNVCATRGDCEGTVPCDPAIEDPVSMTMTVKESCHLPITGIEDQGTFHPLFTSHQSMANVINDNFKNDDFAIRLHDKVFLEQPEDRKE